MEVWVSQSDIRDKYRADFDPQKYLNEYYLVEPEAEDIFVTQFMVRALRKMPPDMLILEFGGGPTLFAVAALAPQAREIHFCDYLTGNLAEVRRWLNDEPNAFDWTPYIEMALVAEGRSKASELVAFRTAEMRRKITRLIQCDALAEAPLGECQGQYDLVVAQSSTETATASIAEWRQIIGNISTLVLPGGWLLLSLITGAAGYSVGRHNFPHVNLTEDEIRQTYLSTGYDAQSFYLEKLVAPGGRGYSGVISVTARKLPSK